MPLQQEEGRADTMPKYYWIFLNVFDGNTWLQGSHLDWHVFTD
jgi:hypothetical protein